MLAARRRPCFRQFCRDQTRATVGGGGGGGGGAATAAARFCAPRSSLTDGASCRCARRRVHGRSEHGRLDPAGGYRGGACRQVLAAISPSRRADDRGGVLGDSGRVRGPMRVTQATECSTHPYVNDCRVPCMRRYGHGVAYHGGLVYVFGGQTSTSKSPCGGGTRCRTREMGVSGFLARG